MDKIAVLIPCYNENKTIEKVITDFQKELPEAKIYVYDNNSTDETEMTIHALDKNMNIETITIEYKDRKEGSESKLHTYSDGARVISAVASLYKNYRPLSFFIWISLCLFIIGTLFLVPVLIDYSSTGLVPKMPSFLASVFFYLCMLQSVSVGLILQTIVKKNRQEFEIILNKYEDKYKLIKNNQLKSY